MHFIIGRMMTTIPVCSVKGRKKAAARAVKMGRNWGSEPEGGTRNRTAPQMWWGFGERIQT